MPRPSAHCMPTQPHSALARADRFEAHDPLGVSICNSTPGTAPLAIAKNKGFVCIVEDDAVSRKALLNLFLSVGLEAQAFSSAAALKGMKLPNSAGCFILNIRLPDLGGLDLHARLIEANLRAPVLFMAAFADIAVVVKAMKAGAADFFVKPFREREMLDAVAEAIEIDGRRLNNEGRLLEAFTRHETLSRREREVMQLVTAGQMNKQIASQLGISLVTVKIHRARVMRKMGAKSLADLVRISERLRRRPSPRSCVSLAGLDLSSPDSNLRRSA